MHPRARWCLCLGVVFAERAGSEVSGGTEPGRSLSGTGLQTGSIRLRLEGALTRSAGAAMRESEPGDAGQVSI